LPYALKLLPRIRAILAFECQDIDYTKQAEEKDKEKEKLAHVNLSPQPRAKWRADAAAFRKDRLLLLLIGRHRRPLEQKTRIAEDRLRLFMFD
jgi:hypothetical protein